MSFLDWIITALPLVIVVAVGIYSTHYVRSVADFMSAGRGAGRYLLAIAGGELQAGVVVFVASFEVIRHAGFTLTWWGWINIPVAIFLGIVGFVSYRFRETRALTLAQFFEIRYSKRFRVFTGILGFFAGICNFGIIPALGASCVSYFWGLPETLTFHSVAVPTYIPLMAVFLSTALFVTITGGAITVMVINCIEGIISQLFYLIIIFALLMMFHWSQISSVLGNQPAGHSLLNPFDSKGIKDFNLGYVLMALALNAYGTMAWQNAGAYNSAALTPHEGRMGGILGRWREMGKVGVITLLAVCALAFLHDPHFAASAAAIESSVQHISNPQAREQMELPIAIGTFLPVGVKGALCAIFLMGIFGGDATHLHSWGSIFVQDILVPLRKKPFETEQHLRILRWAMASVAVFAFSFGCLFHLSQYINMWWQITTAIYVGGAGSAIIGGLYWKKGTTAGAWAALVTGATLSLAGIAVKQIDHDFPLNGTEISFSVMLCAIAVYVTVSLLTCDENFNLERMLHRGKYAPVQTTGAQPKPRLGWSKYLGIDEHYNRTDKWIAGTLALWSLFWAAVFAVGTVWNLIAPWPLHIWSTFWEIVGIGLPTIIAFVTGIWFTWGGAKDIHNLFHRLRAERISYLDDGTVQGHRNLNESERIERTVVDPMPGLDADVLAPNTPRSAHTVKSEV